MTQFSSRVVKLIVFVGSYKISVATTMLRLIGLANCYFWISRSESLRPASLIFKAVKGARFSLVMYSFKEIDLPKITKVFPRR